jgi:hypothetical protein
MATLAHRRNASKAEILEWLGYWHRSSLSVNFGAINSVEDMAEARKWCPVLNTPTTSDRSDCEMFALLQEFRGMYPEVAALKPGRAA